MGRDFRVKVRAPKREPDPDEEAALDCAVASYVALRGADARGVCGAVISEWIVERSRRSVAKRLPADLVFDLNDAQMRGAIAAALPKIGEAVAHLPDDKPLFELTREQIIDVFVAGLTWIGEAEVALGSALGNVAKEGELVRHVDGLDDEIPFG